MRPEFGLDHWQLGEMNSIDQFDMDYRVTQTIQEKCSTFYDMREYLEKTYCNNVAVEFEHVKDEKERLWLYENYEKVMNEE